MPHRALVHVIDGTSPDPLGDWAAINLELELFSPELKDKPQVPAYTHTHTCRHMQAHMCAHLLSGKHTDIWSL